MSHNDLYIQIGDLYVSFLRGLSTKPIILYWT